MNAAHPLRVELRAIRDVIAAKIQKRGVVQTLMRIAEYALTLPENRDALLERRRREEQADG